MQAGLILIGEPYELPEDVRPEFNELNEQLSVEDSVKLDVGVRHEFLLDIVIVAESPMLNTLVFIIALFLGEVKADLKLYLIVDD